MQGKKCANAKFDQLYEDLCLYSCLVMGICFFPSYMKMPYKYDVLKCLVLNFYLNFVTKLDSYVTFCYSIVQFYAILATLSFLHCRTLLKQVIKFFIVFKRWSKWVLVILLFNCYVIKLLKFVKYCLPPPSLTSFCNCTFIP